MWARRWAKGRCRRRRGVALGRLVGNEEEGEVRLRLVHERKAEASRLLRHFQHKLDLRKGDDDALQGSQVLAELRAVNTVRTRRGQLNSEKTVVLPQCPNQGCVALHDIDAVLAAQVSGEVDGSKLASLLPSVNLLPELPEPSQGRVARLLTLLLGPEVDAPFDERELLGDVAQSPGRHGVVDAAEAQKAELEAMQGLHIGCYLVR
mmetsp:Transcript_18696/g.52217  ORF Transcript_18696/g.52217 Transcript_18696/m.52217 type:complete len:206 (-) Transcript_18696:198-815(-)